MRALHDCWLVVFVELLVELSVIVLRIAGIILIRPFQLAQLLLIRVLSRHLLFHIAAMRVIVSSPLN